MSGLFGLFEGRANLQNPAVPLTSASLLDWFGGSQGDAGVAVNEHSSMKMSAVFRCVSLISSVSASLPLHVFVKGTKDRAVSALLEDPHPELTPIELWRLTYVHRCLWGNAYLQKVRNNANEVVELWPIRPDRVRVGRARPTAANRSGKMFEIEDDQGKRQALTSNEIMHLPGLSYDGVVGMSLVRAAAQGIGLALAAESYGARLFGSGNLLSGILKTDQRLEQGQAETLQARWSQMSQGLDRAHRVAVLDSGAAFQSLTMPSSEAQMLESREFQITEASRYWGVPPFLMMQTSKSTSWGTGLEQQAQGWVTFDLHPTWLAPTEQRITKELTGSGEYAKYRSEGLLRGDSAARGVFYRVMREVGAMSANDIRELEDRPPVSGGDSYLQPLNLVPLGTTPDEGTSDASQPAQ